MAGITSSTDISTPQPTGQNPASEAQMSQLKKLYDSLGTATLKKQTRKISIIQSAIDKMVKDHNFNGEYVQGLIDTTNSTYGVDISADIITGGPSSDVEIKPEETTHTNIDDEDIAYYQGGPTPHEPATWGADKDDYIDNGPIDQPLNDSDGGDGGDGGTPDLGAGGMYTVPPDFDYNGDNGDNDTYGLEDEYGSYEAIMNIFMQQPAYEIPQEVFDILNLSTQTAETLANLYSQQREDVLGRLDTEGVRALDILGKSKTDQLREARLMENKMMGAYEEGGQASLDILSQRAYGGMPGETQYLESLEAGTASAVENLIQRGGGSGGALGAMADVYTGQQENQRMLAARGAELQYGAMGELAGAEERYGAGRAGIYESGGKTRIGIRSDMDKTMALTRTNLAGQYAENYQSTTGALGGAIDRGSQIISEALGGIADKRETEWELNAYRPYIDQRNFIIDEYRRADTFDMYTSFMAGMAGQTYDMQMTGVGGQVQGVSDIFSAPAEGLGSYYQMKTMQGWNQ